MIKARKKLDYILACLLILLSPILSLLLAIYKYISSEKNKRYLVYICIFYGFFGLIFLSTPGGDIRNHYVIFTKISKLSLKEFYLFLSNEKDWLIFIYYKILSYFTENPRWIGFFSAMLSYGVPYYLIIDFGHKNKLKKYEIIIFIILFLGITPSYKFSGMRNFNAICLFSLGVYMVDILKNKKGMVYIILAPLLHISLLIVIIIYFLSKYINLTKIKVICSLLFAIIFIKFSKIILLKSLILFPNYSRFLISYIEGENAASIAASWVAISINYIFFFGVYILFYFTLLKRKKLKGLNFFKFLVFYFSFISIFSFSKTIYNRYSENIILLLILLLMYLLKKYLNSNKIFLSIISFAILSYSLMARIEYKTWNIKLISSSIIGILKEGEQLNKIEYIHLRRK